MKIKSILFVLAVFGLYALNACTGENSSNAIKSTDLVGTWECVAGKLDGEADAPFAKTDNTPGAIIKFSETVMEFELLESNLGKSKNQPFTLDGTKINFNNDPDLNMQIKEIEGKNMTLEFKVAEHVLEMKMERQ